MFQKFAPLLVLVLFGLGVYVMIQGMHNAIDMTKSKQEIKK